MSDNAVEKKRIQVGAGAGIIKPNGEFLKATYTISILT
jgi:hypothetical protein